LTIVPFISNGTYWLSIRFNKWKVDQKNIIDKMQLLTLEQSIQIREEISKQGEKFSKLIEEKNLEIAQLTSIIAEHRTAQLSQNHSFGDTKQSSDNESNELDEIAENLKSNALKLSEYDKMVELMQAGYQITERTDVKSKTIAFLESNDIIETKGNGVYKFTEKGKKLLKIMTK